MEVTLINELLQKLKNLYQVDQPEEVFLFAVETAVEDILAFCNLDYLEWPRGLNNVAVRLAMDYLTGDSLTGSAEASSDGDIKTLKEGDFSITKETQSETLARMASMPSPINRYTSTLTRYRKLR